MAIWTAYEPLPGSEISEAGDCEEESDTISDQGRVPVFGQTLRNWRNQLNIRKWISYLILGLVAVPAFLSVFWVSSTTRISRAPTGTCDITSMRKEWRTLRAPEQQSYISAVKCLMEKPSRIRPGDNRTSRYDDFVHTHAAVGGKTHNTASFLPWHRMFINTFHGALRKDCSYEGAMPYWDWVIDSANLTNSPIWDTTLGFGGNGVWDEEQGQQCVRDGPFAGTMRTWTVSNATGKIDYEPHCMSRIFRDASDEHQVFEWLHDLVSPEKVEETLENSGYGSFFLWFQLHTHNAIPFFIRGEWASFQVPNDPVFFLHHTQVDRLWSIWQDRNIDIRAKEYFGPTLDSPDGAKLDDVLEMGGLVPDGRVADYLDIREKHLCYRYQS